MFIPPQNCQNITFIQQIPQKGKICLFMGPAPNWLKYNINIVPTRKKELNA